MLLFHRCNEPPRLISLKVRLSYFSMFVIEYLGGRLPQSALLLCEIGFRYVAQEGFLRNDECKNINKD